MTERLVNFWCRKADIPDHAFNCVLNPSLLTSWILIALGHLKHLAHLSCAAHLCVGRALLLLLLTIGFFTVVELFSQKFTFVKPHAFGRSKRLPFIDPTPYGLGGKICWGIECEEFHVVEPGRWLSIASLSKLIHSIPTSSFLSIKIATAGGDYLDVVRKLGIWIWLKGYFFALCLSHCFKIK